MDAEATYGRNRQSIADLEQQLTTIFQEHPQSHLNDSGEPCIPGNAIVDVLRAFTVYHDSVELMSREEEDQLVQLIESNPGLAVTPQVLLQFIAMRTTINPEDSRDDSPFTEEELGRGRTDERDDDYDHSRSSSIDSSGTSVFRPAQGSRPPSRGSSMSRDSPFDASRRQRSTPLAPNQAPSSWSRRRPPTRRKSDAGYNLSDSESSAPPSAFPRTPGRARAPSNPASPMTRSYSDSGSETFSPLGSPSHGATSRPHSRAQSLSQSQSQFMSLDAQLIQSSDRELPIGLMSPPPSDSSFDEEQLGSSGPISSLPMPRRTSGGESDSDSEEEVDMGLVMDRTTTSSLISLDYQERLDALQRTNADLGKKLVEVERTLQIRLADHELELEDMQGRLEELRSELSATKREEKELRSKERQAHTQIAALESEISKLQKNLENARASYQSLQKQYHEQCSESERYRNDLRVRDEDIRNHKESAQLQSLELQKILREQLAYEERISALEQDLALAQQAQVQLDEQKQENMMLKETIDRMRFDMDEMRAASGIGGADAGRSSAPGTISKSLGAELMSKMEGSQWSLNEEQEAAEEREVTRELEADDGEETEGEDVVQTIITRRRKVPSRSKRSETVTVMGEIKEYSDAAIQHEMSEFTASAVAQTDPEPCIVTATFSVQTIAPLLTSMEIQTEPEPTLFIPFRVEMEVQTDELEPEILSSTDDEDEAMASSSSTVLPPTPKAQPAEQLHQHDLPPAYNQITQRDQDELAVRVADETLRKWHKGLKLPIEAVAGGVSEEALEDWKALKEELGVECTAIDKLMEESTKAGSRPRPRPRKSSRFYNIYNTYVYGDQDGIAVASGQLLFCVGVSAAVAFLIGQAMAPQYVIPGGVTYYDRAAWSSFNSVQAAGEGFSGDSTAAVWGFLGRLGGGAARTLRGWPT